MTSTSTETTAPREGFLARAFWLHPLLAGIAPALFGFRLGKDLLGPLDSLPLLAMFSVAGLVLLGAIALLLREARWSALGASLVLVALHVVPRLPEIWWPLAWVVVGLALLSLCVVRRIRLGWPTALANMFVLLWTALGAWQCLVDGLAASKAPTVVVTSLPAVRPPSPLDERPDIYLLILDGYGRADVLEERQGFRPKLADALSQRGFLIGTEAVSPHARTILSLGALFGLDTLDQLLTDIETISRRPLRRLIDGGAALHLLRAAGYRIVAVPGEFAGSRISTADEHRSAGCVLNEFDYHLVARTALPWLFETAGFQPHTLPHAHRRSCLKTQLERFAEPPTGNEPAFVFAHVVAPHPPFVFRPDGGARPTRAGTLADIGFYRDNRIDEDYSAGYQDQVAWLDREVPATVDRLIASARRPPIVFVMGDHGPGHKFNPIDPTDVQLRERMGILSAVLVPEEVRRDLSPATGPINVMRRILRHVAGADLPPIPERALFSPWPTPYEFRDVINNVRRPAPAETTETTLADDP